MEPLGRVRVALIYKRGTVVVATVDNGDEVNEHVLVPAPHLIEVS